MKTVLRPVVRRVRRLYGQTGRPSNSAETVLARWRSLSSKLLRNRLQREFAPEVEKLAELIGRDLRHWCGPVRERLRAA